MKKTSVLLSSFLIAAFSNSAIAAMDIRGERTSFYERNKPKPLGFNYTYFGIGYRNSTFETDTMKNTVQSLNIEIAFNITRNLSLSLDLTGGAYAFNNVFSETTDINTGLTYHQPISATTDIYGAFNIVNIQYSGSNPNITDSVSGNAFQLGLRQRISPTMEWGANTTFFNIDDVKHRNMALSLTYGADDKTQYSAKYESANTDNKQNSISFNVRFNY